MEPWILLKDNVQPSVSALNLKLTWVMQQDDGQRQV